MQALFFLRNRKPLLFAFVLIGGMAAVFALLENADKQTGSSLDSRDDIEQIKKSGKAALERYMMKNFYLPKSMEEVAAERVEYLAKEGSLSRLGQQATDLMSPNWSRVGPLGIYDFSENVQHSGRVISFDMFGDNPNIMFAGAASGGLWKSSDAGNSWVILMDTLACPSISSIACTQLASDNTVWFSTGSPYNGAGVQIGRVYRSTDGGATWSHRFNTPQTISKIEINPFNKNIVFVAAQDGLYRTTNGGSSFSWINTLPSFCDVITFTSLLVPDTTTVLAARRGTGIFRSTNNGTSFSSVSLPGYDNALDDRITLATNPAAPNRTFALVGKTDGSFLGLWFSTDKGATWTQKTLPQPMGGQQSYNQGLGVTINRVFLGWNAGVTFSSTDDGTTWTQSNWTHPDVHKIHPYNNTLIYQINDGGVFRSTNSGANWNTFGNQFLQIAQAYALYSSNSLPNSIWIGTQDNGVAAGYDDFFNWTGLTCCDGGVYFQHDGYQYMSLEFGTLLANHRLQRKLVSAPITSPWEEFAQGLQSGSPVFGLLPPKDFFAEGTTFYTSMQNWVYKRTTAQTSWGQVGIVAPFSSVNVGRLLLSNGFLLASSEEPAVPNVRRHNPSNNTWETVDLTPLPAGVVVTDLEKGSGPNNVFMSVSGTSGARIFKSTNSGSTWTNITGNLPSLVNVRLLLANKSNDNIIYAGSDFGVFATNNGGTTWVNYSNGLPSVCYVNGLAFENNGNNLYVATYGRGVFKSQVLTGIEDAIATLPESYRLLQNYPNPFNPSTTISFQLPQSDVVSLSVLDVNGRPVRELLIDKAMDAGRHEVHFNASGIASGTYFYRLSTREFSATKKMVLLK